MSVKDGGPAFPIRGDVTSWDASGGMSLRDWFAGQALAGMLAYSSLAHNNPDRAAEWSYQHADAMLAQREAK